MVRVVLNRVPGFVTPAPLAVSDAHHDARLFELLADGIRAFG